MSCHVLPFLARYPERDVRMVGIFGVPAATAAHRRNRMDSVRWLNLSENLVSQIQWFMKVARNWGFFRYPIFRHTPMLLVIWYIPLITSHQWYPIDSHCIISQFGWFYIPLWCLTPNEFIQFPLRTAEGRLLESWSASCRTPSEQGSCRSKKSRLAWGL